MNLRFPPLLGLKRLLAAAFAVSGVMAAEPSAEKLIHVKMSAGPSFLVALAELRGDFRAEGLEVEILDYHQFVTEDCDIYKPLNDGQLDASIHWFQHVFMGSGEGKPIVGVMLLNDAPGMSVLVANRVKDEIKSAADFKGRNVAEGVPLSTKSFVTNYLTVKAGLPPHSYQSVMKEEDNRLPATIAGLKQGQVDVITSMDAMTVQYLATNQVTRLYDFTTKESTTQALGATLPAQCVLMAPSYAKAHPEVAQKLVNALVRTMRFVNSHTPEQIYAVFPADFAKKNREAKLDRIKSLKVTSAQDDYSFHRPDVALIRDAVFADTMIDDEEGKLRADTRKANPPVESYYDNQFVRQAMQEIK
jgi:NitT/TauT family transport system substrate-binding protein